MIIRIGEYIVLILLLTAVLSVLFRFVIMSSQAHKVCLEKGYPKASITWNLEAYCTNALHVEKLGDIDVY